MKSYGQAERDHWIIRNYPEEFKHRTQLWTLEHIVASLRCPIIMLPSILPRKEDDRRRMVLSASVAFHFMGAVSFKWEVWGITAHFIRIGKYPGKLTFFSL